MIKAIDISIAWQYHKAGWVGLLSPFCAPTLDAWLSPPPPQGLAAGLSGAETFKIKPGGALPCVCWLLKNPSLQGPQNETQSESLSQGCAQQQGYSWLDTGALDLSVPSLSYFCSGAWLWSGLLGPKWYIYIFQDENIFLTVLTFSHGKIYAHGK